MRPHTVVMSVALALFMAGVPGSAFAQDPPPVSFRPFFVASVEKFTATETFSAVFGSSVQPVYGGGLSVAFRSGLYFDVTASRFKKTGERAFFFDGKGFGLGIPLTATLTPLEVTVGARTHPSPSIFPYVGVGIGTYKYEESSELDEGAFSKRHLGWLIVGGVEFRVSRWVGISGDVQYNRVSGIIGAGGVSLEAGEDDLGGTAGRVRVIVGR